MAGASSTSSSLKEYLKKYASNDDEKKKKKKKKKMPKPDASGVLVVDEDPVWQKPVQLDEDEEDSADEEKPLVEEDIEVKRMRRLEQLRVKRPYGAISEDGSGWVSVSNSQSTLKSEDQNSDISPPRKTRHRNDTPSPKNEQAALPVDPDLSPPRKSRRHRNDTPSPKHELSARAGDPDLSPPRKSRRHRNDTPSPNHDKQSEISADPDLSPPRRSRRHHQDPSPVAETKASHFRSARIGRFDTPSPEPHLESSKHDADLSPPRRKQREFSETTSSTRKSVHNAGSCHASDRAASVSDISPPRRRQKEPQVLVHQPKTGLVSGRDIKDEIDKKKKEDWLRFKEMDPSISGRDAEAVYRNKITGERMSKDEFLESQKKLKKKDEKPKEIKLEWGKGLAQKREAEERFKELEAEKDKPFARSRDDPDLDAMLKERVRWGDPMAHLVKKKLDPILPDLSQNERMKESGFIVPQEIPKHSWIKRGVDAPSNRYGIKPGRHWDGVDRSNGFEKEMFKRTNERSATEREAYLWSVADM